MARVNYRSSKVPSGYKCLECGVTDCKLWREYNTFSPNLLCAACAAKDQSKDVSLIDDEGMYPSEFGGKSDQIGWYVPAIPDQDGPGYWGYTSVPQAGCEWWKRLPTLP
jgi:hypothetical protein